MKNTTTITNYKVTNDSASFAFIEDAEEYKNWINRPNRKTGEVRNETIIKVTTTTVEEDVE